MSDEFLITEERLDTIAQTFGVERGSVGQVYREYKVLEPLVKEHHLAHVIRAMEAYFRKSTGKRDFYIVCEPYRRRIRNRQDAMAAYGRNKFSIYYNGDLTEREKRIIIAHELGHLFLYTRVLNNGGTGYNPKFERTVEPLSSILGLFFLTDKNHFYETLDAAGYEYPDWKCILDDFKRLYP